MSHPVRFTVATKICSLRGEIVESPDVFKGIPIDSMEYMRLAQRDFMANEWLLTAEGVEKMKERQAVRDAELARPFVGWCV